MSTLRSLISCILTPHNPKNVAAWLFHRLMNAKPTVAAYRAAILPIVIQKKARKKRLRVVFLPMNCAMWRYDDIYRKMLADDRFDPIIVTAPRIIQPKESYVREQREMVEYFHSLGHAVTTGFDEKSDKWINLSDLEPDIVFYTQPYDGLLPGPFEYWHNLRSLICYTPYSFQLSKASWNWNNAIQNYAWRHYISLPYHKQTCRDFSNVKARNAIPVGYFFEEEYQKACNSESRVNAIWRNDNRKRIIWAPHHSIASGAEFKTSAFLEICDDMLALRNEYADKIIIAFKPHPMLLDNLYKTWGKEKTDAYYKDWATGKNSFLDDGAFVPLFAGSDAMIHCSGSFIVDYIYTQKPVQYVYCKDRNAPDFGAIGDAALSAHYPARCATDIRKFVEDVVIGADDPMQANRKAVYEKFLQSPNGKTFSENVIENICKDLDK